MEGSIQHRHSTSVPAALRLSAAMNGSAQPCLRAEATHTSPVGQLAPLAQNRSIPVVQAVDGGPACSGVTIAASTPPVTHTESVDDCDGMPRGGGGVRGWEENAN